MAYPNNEEGSSHGDSVGRIEPGDKFQKLIDLLAQPSPPVAILAFNIHAKLDVEIEGRPAEIVRIIDAENFSGPFAGLNGGLDELICRLRRINRGADIRIVGEGEGASVAMLAGLALPQASVFALNPQPFVGRARSIRHPFWGDATSVAAAYPFRQNAATFVSAWDPDCVSVLGDPDALSPAFGSTFALPCVSRALDYLLRCGVIGALFREGVEAIRRHQASGDIGTQGISGTRSQYAAMAYVSEQLSAKSLERKQALGLCRSEAGWRNPGWQHLRSKLLKRAKALPEALEAASMATHEAPHVASFCTNYARLVQETKAFESRDQAITLLQPFIKQRGIAALQDALMRLV